MVEYKENICPQCGLVTCPCGCGNCYNCAATEQIEEYQEDK